LRLLQLDSGRGLDSNLCPLQTTSASAGAGTSVADDRPAIARQITNANRMSRPKIFRRE
jgi:hypothetical protein